MRRRERTSRSSVTGPEVRRTMVARGWDGKAEVEEQEGDCVLEWSEQRAECRVLE